MGSLGGCDLGCLGLLYLALSQLSTLDECNCARESTCKQLSAYTVRLKSQHQQMVATLFFLVLYELPKRRYECWFWLLLLLTYMKDIDQTIKQGGGGWLLILYHRALARLILLKHPKVANNKLIAIIWRLHIYRYIIIIINNLSLGHRYIYMIFIIVMAVVFFGELVNVNWQTAHHHHRPFIWACVSVCVVHTVIKIKWANVEPFVGIKGYYTS